MAYNATALQQMTGDALKRNLKQAFGAFYQEEQYVDEVHSVMKQQENLKQTQEIWSIQNAIKHPAGWMLALLAALAAAEVILFRLGEAGNESDAVLLGVSCLMGMMLMSVIVEFIWIKRDPVVRFGWLMKLLMKPVLDQLEKWNIKGKLRELVLSLTIGGIFLLVLRAVLKNGARGIMVFLFVIGLLGTYAFLAWLDCVAVRPDVRKKEAQKYYGGRAAELEEELAIAQAQLQSWRRTGMMAFAHAAVPERFWNTRNLAALIARMDEGAIFTLQQGIAAYDAYEFREDQRRQLEKIYWQQVRQSEAMQEQLRIQEQQRRAAQQHYREMRDLEWQRNETLRDMKREQAEHNQRMEGYFNGR